MREGGFFTAREVVYLFVLNQTQVFFCCLWCQGFSSSGHTFPFGGHSESPLAFSAGVLLVFSSQPAASGSWSNVATTTTGRR